MRNLKFQTVSDGQSSIIHCQFPKLTKYIGPVKNIEMQRKSPKFVFIFIFAPYQLRGKFLAIVSAALPPCGREPVRGSVEPN